MVGATTHQQQQQAPQLAPPSSSSSTAPTTTPEEDEFLKRNTDCVYFLASPLTCKKGSECEYRHSDIARVNPRDCWYWLNGNCLNPKCAFRHPPLDGLLGPDVSTPMAPPSAPTPHPPSYNTPKQGVACIFFQKGFCLKGHLCPFLHGPPNSVNTKPTQTNTVTEPPKITPPETTQKVVDFKVKQPPLLARNGGTNIRERVVPPPPVMNEPPVINHNPNPSFNHGYHVLENERVLNGKDADEYSREPSPGFDVLVDNEVEESEFYHAKDEFVRSRGQGQDYDVDRDHHDYDRYNERDGQFGWDDRRESSGRILVGSTHLERRPYSRSNSPEHLDLRHRISKQRRVSENTLDRIPRRDSHHHHDNRHNRRQEQGGLSSRLRGRIKIPGRSRSPSNERVEREIDMGRRNNSQSRYSPGRPLSINSRVNRDNRVRDNNGDDERKFAGPKRLSELKSGRTSEVLEDGEILGKRKKVEDDLSFEGPKPLSEILKRKRGTENRISSVIIEKKEKEREIAKEEDNSLNDFEEEKHIEDGKDEEKEVMENEGNMVDEDALLDEELEAYDHKDGDYEYDQIDGEEEDYNLDEGEFVDEELME